MRKGQLDDIDMAIIENILRGKTQSEIAEMLGITLRTVQNRVRALEDNGYLIKIKEGYWKANYQKLGLSMLTVTFVDLDIESKTRIDEIIEHFNKLDYVENVLELVGSAYDLCFVVRYRDIEEFNEERRKFMEWFVKKGIKINHLATYISSKTHKDHRRTTIRTKT
ncbi:Lrp/AsnC family transcriptional regulator [Archaeoglobus fulgidus]|jgi:DNA-binding Lrp family transcriptional regulator|uniref:Transcriptional regulatory protein, AsnC family n=3 Tax=Archaeoglobus fulgidus TaxID=2234 RepID=O29810_ARCFU|nr:Lrp/AsnC family transcriptional regulator [Archaeoglobus fulgidus]AAB90794.1 transcriptional regulatory protein, AsnC family [Archaeoglobus fulgidus DSM 4304]AIG97257.1 Transcriptional regulator [Archaeoglobus fulgidus DSM 8774]KUJ92582.1 MAG: Transcriptional regulatory protein, AsnC family [Archaeoglobus fulgidus]KUK05711.1 MAG: Transcriptional regulatory protein, AsnC family [Archaeoglobus fulgidus]